MGASVVNTLLYQIEAMGLDKLDNILSVQKRIDAQTKLSTGELQRFSSAIQTAGTNLGSYTKALDQVASGAIKANEKYKDLAKVLLDTDKAQRAATVSAERESQRRIQIAQREAAEEQRSANASFQANMRVWKQQETERRRIEAARIRDEARSERALVQNLRGGNVLAGINNSRTLDPMIARIAGGAAAPILGGLAVAGVAEEIVRSATTDARNLQNLANEMGITASQAFKLDAAAKLSGQSMDALGSTARKLQEALDAPGGAGKKTAEELTKLGISLNQNLGSALEQTLQKLANIPDAGTRSAEAMRLFGEQGPKIAEIAGNLKDVGQTLDENVQKKLLAANRSLADFGNTWTIVKGQIAATITSTIGSFWNSYDSTISGLEGIGASDYDKVTGKRLQGDSAAALASRRPGVPAGVDLFGQSSRLSTALGSGKLSLDDQITSAKADWENASALGRNMRGSQPIAAQDKQAGVIDAARKRYEDLEAKRRKPVTTVDAFPDAAARYLESSETRDLGPLGSAVASRDELIRRFGARASGTAYQGFRERLGFGQDGTLQPGRGIIGGYGRDAAKSAMEEARRNQRVLNAGGWGELGMSPESPEAKAFSYRLSHPDEEMSKAPQLYRQSLGLNLQSQVSSANNISNYLGGIRSTAGTNTPNNEFRAQMESAERLRSIRDQMANLEETEDEKQMARARSYYEFVESAQKATLDREQRIAELAERSHQETGNFTAGLTNAALDGNVGGFFRSFGRQQISTIAGNFGKNLPFTLNSAGSLGGTGMLGSADKPSFLGKLLQGSVFGLDPGKAANPGIDTNTVATVANTGATQALTSVIASISGVSPAAIAAAGGGVSGGLPASIGSIGGLTGTPPFLANQLLSNSDIGIPRASSGISLPNIGGAGGASGGYAGAGGIMQQIMGGAGSVLSGQALNSVLYGGTKDASGAWTSSTGMERLGAGIGLGASTAGGVLGAISGFKSGGGRGITKGLASSLAAAAPFAGPAAPFLTGGAAITGLISSLFPDPRKQRMEQMENTLTGAAYIQPSSRAYSFGNSGGSGFSYGEGGSIMAGGPRTQAPVVNLNVSALDAKSMVGYFQDNSAQFGQALLYGMQNSGVSALGAQMNLMTGGSGW